MAKKHETSGNVMTPLPEQDVMEKRMEDERNALFPSDGELIDDGIRNRPPADIVEQPLQHGFVAVGDHAAYAEMPLVDAVSVTTSAGATVIEPDPFVSGVMAFVDLEIAKLGAQLREELVSIAGARANGISASMVGSFFNCPECGIRIQGPALTSQKGGLYDHGFGEAPTLGKQRCSYTGKKFKAPVIFLELAGK